MPLPKKSFDVSRRINPVEFERRAKATNWRKDGGPAGRGGSTITFGEGSGPNLGLDRPKHDVWFTSKEATAAEAAEVQHEFDKAERKAAGIAKAKKTRAARKNRLKEITIGLDSGGMLDGQRLFHMTWQKKKWDIRVDQFGGMPEGVDVAHSQFGEVLLVPVIEKLEAVKLKLDAGYIDRDGRQFWVALELRKRVELIFGRVVWTQALRVEEATKEFGIRLTQ